MKERLVMVVFLLVFWGMITARVVRHLNHSPASEAKGGAQEMSQAERFAVSR